MSATQRVPGGSGADEFRTENPMTGEVEQSFGTLSTEELEHALTRAQKSYQNWSRSPLTDRVQIIARAADLFEERQDQLARLASREMGKPLGEALQEVLFCSGILHHYAADAAELLAERTVKEGADFEAVLQTLPVGPLLGIMPWNFPYYQVIRFAAPNLVLGNTVLIKHAPTCPQVSLMIEGLMLEAGVPDGAFQNIFVSHEQVETIIGDPRVRGVSLTGSDRAGAIVAEIAGRHLKKVVLELGGSDAHVYLGVADVKQAAREAVKMRLTNGGQVCTSNKRLLVLEGLYDDFVAEAKAAIEELAPGDPMKPDESSYYPLSSVAAADRVLDQVQRAVDQGATLLAGGGRPERPGAWMEPTLLAGITPSMDAYTEEFFGPVLMVYPIKDAEEAVALANASPYGLSGAVFSTDEAEARRIAEQFDTGMVNVNTPGHGAPDLPFGGTKRSGFGRELGDLGIYEFANRKLLYVRKVP